MTSAPSQPTREDLEFDVADRMRRALRISDTGVQEMADYLGVSRNTVSTWINGRIAPSVQTQRLWALRTGVPFGWLQTGELPPRGDDPEGEGVTVRHQGLEPRTRCFGDTTGVIDFSHRRTSGDVAGLSRSGADNPTERRAA